jgi:hypothetical protein
MASWFASQHLPSLHHYVTWHLCSTLYSGTSISAQHACPDFSPSLAEWVLLITYIIKLSGNYKVDNASYENPTCKHQRWNKRTLLSCVACIPLHLQLNKCWLRTENMHTDALATAIILHTMSVWIKICASVLFSLNLLEYQCTSCRTKRLYNLWIAGSGSQPSFSSGNDSFLNNSEYLSGSEVWAPWPAKWTV